MIQLLVKFYRGVVLLLLFAGLMLVIAMMNTGGVGILAGLILLLGLTLALGVSVVLLSINDHLAVMRYGNVAQSKEEGQAIQRRELIIGGAVIAAAILLLTFYANQMQDESNKAAALPEPVAYKSFNSNSTECDPVLAASVNMKCE